MAARSGGASTPAAQVPPSHSVPYVRMLSMIGTSARPFSVSAYSTRGGTSGYVRRSRMPSSSSARSRSDSVRGEMPPSERSSSQNRERPSDRSRTIRSVHFPQTMSAVRQTGQSGSGIDVPFYRNALRTEVDLHVALLRAAHDAQRERRGARLERVEQVVDAPERLAARRDQQVAALDPGARRGRVVDDAAHQQPVALRQPDRGAQLARRARMGERDAEPRPLGALAA